MIAYVFHDQFNAALIVNGPPSRIFGRELDWRLRAMNVVSCACARDGGACP